jgi:hypothetical protein
MLREERGVGVGQAEDGCEYVILFGFAKYSPEAEAFFERAAQTILRENV